MPLTTARRAAPWGDLPPPLQHAMPSRAGKPQRQCPSVLHMKHVYMPFDLYIFVIPLSSTMPLIPRCLLHTPYASGLRTSVLCTPLGVALCMFIWYCLDHCGTTHCFHKGHEMAYEATATLTACSPCRYLYIWSSLD